MKIFIVSLVDCVDRRVEISKRLNDLGLEFEFFDAVDARKGVPKFYENRIDRVLAKKRLGHDMVEPLWGGALSHSVLYEKLWQDKIEHCLILEDDAIFNHDLKTMIHNKILEEKKYPFVIFEHFKARRYFWDFGEKFLGKYRLYTPQSEIYSAAGYYVNRDMIKVLYEATKIVSHTADWPIDASKYAKVCHPRLIQQPPMEEGKSLIEAQRQNTLVDNPMPLWVVSLKNSIAVKILSLPFFLLYISGRILMGKKYKKKIQSFCSVSLSPRFGGK